MPRRKNKKKQQGQNNNSDNQSNCRGGNENQASGSTQKGQNYHKESQSGCLGGKDNQASGSTQKSQNYHRESQSGCLGGKDNQASGSTQKMHEYPHSDYPSGDRPGDRRKNRTFFNTDDLTHQNQHESPKKSKKEHPEFVFFWRKDSPFSQWHESEFQVGNNTFSCAEQYMMFRKAELFEDYEVCDAVLQTNDPREHKKLGRQVRYFDQKVWDNWCFEIVKEGNLAKFTQNERLKKELLSTGNKTLVEASPLDKIWGIGLAADDERAWNRKTWKGRNLLGFALTDIREEIKRIEHEKNSGSLSANKNKEKTHDMQKDTNDMSCMMDSADFARGEVSMPSMRHVMMGNNDKEFTVLENTSQSRPHGTNNKETNDPLSEFNNLEVDTHTKMSTWENRETNNRTKTGRDQTEKMKQDDGNHHSKDRNGQQQQNQHKDNQRKSYRNQGSGWAREGKNDQRDNRNQGSGWTIEGHNDQNINRNQGGRERERQKGQRDDMPRGWGRHRNYHKNADQKNDNIKEHPEFVFFWQKHSPFSQWHESEFTVGDNTFSCAEQFMMFKKAELFGDDWVCKAVLRTNDPQRHKKLGRQVRNFNQTLWDEHCFDIVKEGNFEKFTQNERLKKELLSTGNKTLVEASPLDKIWGIGLAADDERAWNKETWKGQNLLGYALTEVREKIKMHELGTKEGAAESKCKDKPIREADKGPEIATNLNDTKATVAEIPVNNENDIEMMDTTDSTTSNDESRTELNSNSSANTKMSASSVVHEQSGDNGKDPLVPHNENGGSSADTSNQVTNKTLPETNSCEMQTNKTEAMDASNPPCSLENSNDKEVDEVNKDTNDGDKMDTKEPTSSSRERTGECMSKPTALDPPNETIPHENSPCVKNDNEESNDANRLSRENELQTMDTTDSANAATLPGASSTQTQGEKKMTFAEMVKRKK